MDVMMVAGQLYASHGTEPKPEMDGVKRTHRRDLVSPAQQEAQPARDEPRRVPPLGFL